MFLSRFCFPPLLTKPPRNVWGIFQASGERKLAWVGGGADLAVFQADPPCSTSIQGKRPKVVQNLSLKLFFWETSHFVSAEWSTAVRCPGCHCFSNLFSAVGNFANKGGNKYKRSHLWLLQVLVVGHSLTLLRHQDFWFFCEKLGSASQSVVCILVLSIPLRKQKHESLQWIKKQMKQFSNTQHKLKRRPKKFPHSILYNPNEAKYVKIRRRVWAICERLFIPDRVVSWIYIRHTQMICGKIAPNFTNPSSLNTISRQDTFTRS